MDRRRNGREGPERSTKIGNLKAQSFCSTPPAVASFLTSPCLNFDSETGMNR